MPRPKRPSQQQIARDLGLSQTLVSLALNGHRDACSARSYRAIWTHAVAVGYRGCGIQLSRRPAKLH